MGYGSAKGDKGAGSRKPSEDPHFFKVQNGDSIGNWVVVGKLGKGTFSNVYKAKAAGTGEENMIVAIKVLDPQAQYIQYTSIAEREAEILRNLAQFDVFLRFYEVINLTQNGRQFVGICTEAMSESVYDVVQANGPSDPKDVVKLGVALFSALQHLDSFGIVHTDIKHKNAMMNNRDFSQAKLIDFGNAVRREDPKHYPIHTKQFRAPEVLLKYKTYGPPSDVWCVGHVLYYALYGELLFNTHDTKVHMRQMSLKLGPFPPAMGAFPPCFETTPVDGEHSLGTLFYGVLRLDPDERWTPKETLEVLHREGPVALASDSSKSDPQDRREWREKKEPSKNDTNPSITSRKQEDATNENEATSRSFYGREKRRWKAKAT